MLNGEDCLVSLSQMCSQLKKQRWNERKNREQKKLECIKWILNGEVDSSVLHPNLAATMEEAKMIKTNKKKSQEE